VESKRIDGQVRQKTVANLGRLDIITKTNMADVLVEKLLEYTKQKQLIDLAATQAEYAKEYGSILVFRRLWESLGFERFFAECLGRYNYQTDLKESLLAIVINRLLEPKSEHAIEKWLDKVYEQRWEGIKLQHLYRGLDFLERHWADFEKDFFLKVTDLFSQQLDLIMFDTTTIKYWGEGKEAEILQHGYSKDKRGDLKQLIVGVLMSKDGYPVAAELIQGNTPDVKSFIEAVKKLKIRYNIGKIIWVCDRGMVSKKNLEELKEFKQEYIFGVRMRQFDQQTRRELLNPKDMWEVKDNLYVKEVYKEGVGRYIVCFNPQEKELKHHKRVAFKRHLNKKLAASSPKDWMIKNGYKKYVDFEGTISLNEKKLYEEGQYDGYWVLLTNTTMETRDVALRYKDLWQIEHGFRDLKSELETSPIFHYKERRIKAHVHICFLALILKIALEKKLKAIEPKCSYWEVLDALQRIKAVKLTSGKDEMIFRTEFPEKAHLAFKALSLAPPPRILVYNKSKSVVSRPDEV
jgi:transposase